MKLENKIDIKVFILYLLNNVGEPLEFTTVNDIVLQDEFVNYFDFAFCFSELLEAEQIDEITTDDALEPRYVISQNGKETLDSYESSLLPVIRERALKSALRLVAYNRTGKRMLSDITECGEGYTLKCSIVDKKKTLFSVELYLAEKEYAEKLRANFEDRAEIIYRGALSLLSGDVDFIFDD
ncbi:MAG: DUF4364 family protein [Clostridia bacterium]|nr:DUF4364 family protein [Clostridia bacterium]MBR6783688.1 DUF4364 family protein [Clostridia bacterium]